VNLYEEDGCRTRRRNYTPPKSDQKFSADYMASRGTESRWTVKKKTPRFQVTCDDVTKDGVAHKKVIVLCEHPE
jgi:hypothetical protein